MCGTFEQIRKVHYMKLEDVTPKSRPWLAILVLKRRPEMIRALYPCGGTLITSTFVLTAAHCMHEDLEFVRFGEYDVNNNQDRLVTPQDPMGTLMENPQNVPILKFIAHEKYVKDSSKNDIALISLRYPVRFNNFIRPICLPIFPDGQVWSQTEKYLEVHGWGIRDQRVTTYTPTKAYVRRLPSSECNITVDSQVCIDAYETDSCRGDSGGSLTFLRLFNSKARFVQAGIMTERHYDCEKTPVKVYTDVSEYMGWITNKLAIED
ncbi:serine protease grass-like isoform X2 [Drosophila bipectinata]